MKAYYVITTSKDKIGNRRYTYKIVFAETKAEVRKKLQRLYTIKNIYTKEQIPEGFEKNWL